MSEPFYNVGAGEIIKEEIECRGWTKKDFSEKSGLGIETVNKIIDNKIVFTPFIAGGIAKAFGTSLEMWLKMDAEYQSRKERESRPVYSPAPVRYIKEM